MGSFQGRFGVLGAVAAWTLVSCTTFQPIPGPRIDESVLGSETLSNVQFGAVYHASPVLQADGSTLDWGIDAFDDSTWPLAPGLALGTPLLSLKWSPFPQDESGRSSGCFNLGCDLGTAIALSSKYESFVLVGGLGYESQWKLGEQTYFHQSSEVLFVGFDRIGWWPYEYGLDLRWGPGYQVTPWFALEGALKYAPKYNAELARLDLSPASLSVAGIFDALRYVRVTTVVDVSPFETYGDNIVLHRGNGYSMTTYVASRGKLDLHVILGWYY